MPNTNMRKAILDFPQQFAFIPKIQNSIQRTNIRRFVVLGMGGSHLAADLLRTWKPESAVTVHHDYGLPALSASEKKDTLIIASSYSGNTQEVLDGCTRALSAGYAVAAVATGGKLLALAEKKNLPFVRLPDTHIQPRCALGYSMTALLALMGDAAGQTEAKKLSAKLRAERFEKRGKELAKKFTKRVPIIYASSRNAAIAYNWKIKLNETGKIPAFCNTIPELNHNEMNGFDVANTTKALSDRMAFVMLTDTADDPRIQKRMRLVTSLYEDRNLRVEQQPMAGASALEKIFSSLLIADWFSLSTAEQYGQEAELVPMVEEFKGMMDD